MRSAAPTPAEPPFTKVLVANRGEIAVRVMRACRELGVQTVAIYSEADRLAPHVLEADEAYPIGPAPSAKSYLRGDAIVEVAARAGCQAVHPGYGFLAERAAFARAVEAAGLVFVGPPAAAIAAMGDKTEARRRMIEAAVPVVPGTADPLEDAEAAVRAASSIGYPVMLKAAAGGGGKGMRVVRAESDLARAFEAASREARASFGDGSVYLEKYLEGPRHIEIQILADAHGHVVSLGERECSIQRRHQKMVEEAPSAVLTPELRTEMGRAATAAAAAVGYRNAGTVEFLYESGSFYFLEMNTRLQVEHPVTELVTGIDLVKWQLRVAAGVPLAFGQADIRLRGHALECRITSEDPWSGFMPSTGRIEQLQLPSGPGIRWDGGVVAGSEISLYYDPLIGKLIAFGDTREEAISRMERALGELRISGVESATAFLRRVVREPDFRAGRIDILYLDRHPDLLQPPQDDESIRAVAVAAALLEERERRRSEVRRIDTGSKRSVWRDTGWRG